MGETLGRDVYKKGERSWQKSILELPIACLPHRLCETFCLPGRSSKDTDADVGMGRLKTTVPM